jgi:sulfhydrogenase subunit gamma (sulfur reductase)
MSIVTQEPVAKIRSPYLPRPAKILSVEEFTPLEKRLRIGMSDGQPLDYLPMQFLEVSLYGIGEAPISVASDPSADGTFELCVRKVGAVTEALHQLKAGDSIGIRGPYGNGFDGSQHRRKDFLFVAGGIGLAPVRSLIQYVLRNRAGFGRVVILSGFRSPAHILFNEDLEEWQRRDDCECYLTVDRPDESWKGRSGVITTLFPEIALQPANSLAVIVGPPVMFKFAVLEALTLGFREDQIICSLERRMKCGIGKCGHCQINGTYVCQCGPVFTYQEVRRLKEGI